MSLKVTKSGYWYVKLPDWEKVKNNKKTVISHARFDKSKFSGEITCVLTTKTPVHIGSGTFELAKDAGYTTFDGVVKAIVKENGLPVIPGSSLKGAFRSISEAISYSCILEKRFGFQTCDVKDENSKICVCCSIFGAMGFMGRIAFSKATIIDRDTYLEYKPSQPIKLISLNQPRKDKAQRGRKFYPPIDYFSEEFWRKGSPEEYYITIKRAHRGNKHLVVDERYTDKKSFEKGKVAEPYDFIPKDTELKFTVKYENLKPEEIGLVLIGIGLNQENQPEFYPRLGGVKPLCFGVIQVRVEDFKVHSHSVDFTHFNTSKNSAEAVKEWVKKSIQEVKNASEVFFKAGYDQIKNILKYPAPIPEVLDWREVFDEFKK